MWENWLHFFLCLFLLLLFRQVKMEPHQKKILRNKPNIKEKFNTSVPYPRSFSSWCFKKYTFFVYFFVFFCWCFINQRTDSLVFGYVPYQRNSGNPVYFLFSLDFHPVLCTYVFLLVSHACLSLFPFLAHFRLQTSEFSGWCDYRTASSTIPLCNLPFLFVFIFTFSISSSLKKTKQKYTIHCLVLKLNWFLLVLYAVDRKLGHAWQHREYNLQLELH